MATRLTLRSPADAERAAQLGGMKRLATGLLLLATLVFLVARVLEGDDGPAWLGYVRATAEAGMVGALADWFAVTALFRYPLGIRIPHTAIIPNRKDSIGRGLGDFVQHNFLSPDAVAEKLRSVGMAERLAAWLSDPANASKLGDQAGAVARSGLEVLRDEELQEVVGQALLRRLRAQPVAPLAARALDAAIAGGRHQELLSAGLRVVGRTLEENREPLRLRLEQESPWWVPESVDDRVFAKAFNTVQQLLAEVADDPDHELRAHFDRRIHELADDLRHSPETQRRAEELKEEVLDHPAVQEWARSIWGQVKASLLSETADPGSELRQRFDEGVVRFGQSLRDDPELQAKVDGWVERAVVALVRQSGHEIAELISSTVERWDATETTERIELQVGRDLQFIRINGTVVGGLAGLVIHAVSELIG